MYINSISESRSKTFNQCRLKYKYRYINRLREDEGVKKDAMSFGSYIHRIFELGHDKSSLADLQIIAQDERKNYHITKAYEKKIDVCLKNFLRLNSSLYKHLAAEIEYSIKVNEDKDISFIGIIDRVIEGKDGKILILDYKTSRKEMTKFQLYQDRQLQGYVYAISQMYNKPISDIMAGHYYPQTDNLVTVQFNSMQIRSYVKNRVDEVWKIRKLKAHELGIISPPIGSISLSTMSAANP